MQRRAFISLLGGAAAWPVAARAQQAERVRRVGMLIGQGESDQIRQAALGAFRDGLGKLGWIEQRNLRLDVRYIGGDADRIHDYAAELVNLSSEVIVAATGAGVRELQQQTLTIPIVLVGGGAIVANGLVRDIAHPESNVTGIANLYGSISGKWVQLLKEAAPSLTTIGLVYNPQLVPEDGGYFSAIQDAARALAVKTAKLPFQDTLAMVRAIDMFAAAPHGALIVLPPAPNAPDRKTIRELAAEHRLPAIYPARQYAAEGGLMAYGSNPVDLMARAAFFVDRILRGVKVSELPVEFPTRFELTINLATAKVIGLAIPESLLLIADEVIE
jgi:putative ABC transport system substrate-binding protein